jgi:hypothetical protein
MKASGDGSRSARRWPVRSQKRTCESRAVQTRKGHSERRRFVSPWRTRRATCRSTVSPGMNSSVKIPHSGKQPPNCSTRGGAAPAARSQATSCLNSAKLMSSAALMATSNSSWARVWMESRYTLLPCWRPSRLILAPPGGMSASEMRAPWPSRNTEPRTSVESSMAWCRCWASPAVTVSGSKTTTSFQP